MNQDKKIIVLFDGVCNLCNGFVNFIIKQDKKARIKFVTLQSDIAKDILKVHQINHLELNSVIVLIDDKIYTKSSAALMILNELGGVWKIFFAFYIIPKFIRDFFYNIVAKYRYILFGKKEICIIPSQEIVDRFIHD